MLIVRAAKRIPANTELTFWYLRPGETDFSAWGFECNCAICVERKNTKPKVARRVEKLVDEFREKIALLGPRSETADVERLLCAIEKTVATTAPSALVADLREDMARAYMKQKRLDKMVDCCFRGLKALGFVIEGGMGPTVKPIVVREWGLVTDDVVQFWFMLWAAYELMELKNAATAAKRYCKLAYLVCMGEDETFEETYGRLLTGEVSH